ncbi:MAG: transposase, partial [Lutibacter sp.]|nr:transposase [Lutibacter sp.]
KPLGRKPKEDLNRYHKKKLKKERGEKNHIEGKFGQGKTKYKLNNIMAKLENTSESWIAAIIFVMNIIKLAKDYLFAFFYWLFFIEFYSNNSGKPKSNLIYFKF